MKINSQTPITGQQTQVKKQEGEFPTDAFFGKDKVDINFQQIKASDCGPDLPVGCAVEGCKASAGG